MTPLRFFFAFMLAIAPFQGHPEPPKGWYCQPAGKGVNADHACTCHRVAEATAEDPDCCESEVTEEPACKSWCHPKHCKCRIICAPKPGGAP